MTIKDILAKLAKGETLTEAETQFLGQYDPDKAANDAAAAARRKAEEAQQKAEKERDELKAKIEDLQKKVEDASSAGKTDQEKQSQLVKTLSDQVQALTKRLETADKEKAQLTRNQTLDVIRQNAGVHFVDGVDEGAMAGLFRGEFEGLTDEQLADETVVKGVVDKFAERFKGVIRDSSGHGGGTPPHLGGGAHTTPAKNPYKEDSFNLTQQALLERKDPATAKRLAAEAGVTIDAEQEA